MDRERFFKVLAQTRHHWYLAPEGQIRTYGELEVPPMSPITAVCRKETGFTFTLSNCNLAAEELGLDEELARSISDAADDCALIDASLRRQLLAATVRRKGMKGRSGA